jgi:uncharacterized short protein YbdD (DUF466 family)
MENRKVMSEWKIKKLKRAYYKQLIAGFIDYETYISKLRELRQQTFKKS